MKANTIINLNDKAYDLKQEADELKKAAEDLHRRINELELEYSEKNIPIPPFKYANLEEMRYAEHKKE